MIWKIVHVSEWFFLYRGRTNIVEDLLDFGGDFEVRRNRSGYRIKKSVLVPFDGFPDMGDRGSGRKRDAVLSPALSFLILENFFG